MSLSELRLFLPHCTVFAAEGKSARLFYSPLQIPWKVSLALNLKSSFHIYFFILLGIYLSLRYMFEFWRQAFGTTQAGLLHWPINFKQMNRRKNAMWSINDGVAGDALNSCGRFLAKKTTAMVFPVLI